MKFINKTSLNFLLGFVVILAFSFVVMVGVNGYDETQAINCEESDTC